MLGFLLRSAQQMRARARMSDQEDHCSTGSHEGDEDFGEDYYYGAAPDDCEDSGMPEKKIDPEFFEFDVLSVEDVERLLNESVADVCLVLQIDPSLAKALLHMHSWKVDDIINRYNRGAAKLLMDSHLLPVAQDQKTALALKHDPSKLRGRAAANGPVALPSAVGRVVSCDVCSSSSPPVLLEFHELVCGHKFCKLCWLTHIRTQLMQGISTGLECMQPECHVLVPESFVLSITRDSAALREKYQIFAFKDYVKNHPQLRFCPGPNCHHIIRAKERKPRRVCCVCKTQFCFSCGNGYHAPTTCEVIKNWLTKCADDTETAHYITANTKDCPKCNVCIEKNGGCNHMCCSKCKYDFCWMCLGEWKVHGGEYYECSRYKENPGVAADKCYQAREALKKYLFYFERWQTHANSLKLEEQEKQAIRKKIEDLVTNSKGTWIDWQYLLDATELLRKCRYTLQYTYPYAYYMESGMRKDLFEYQQAKLQVEVENLSWKIQNDVPNRGELENQMDVAEKMRLTLLKDFVDT